MHTPPVRVVTRAMKDRWAAYLGLGLFLLCLTALLGGEARVRYGADVNPVVIDTIDVGQGPLGVGVDPGANVIYVANFLEDTVTAINGATDRVITTLGLGTNPFGVAVNRSNHLVYVTNSTSNHVTVFDPAEGAIIAVVDVCDEPAGVDVNPNTNLVYVANQL